MYLFCLLVKYLNEYLLERSQKLNKEGSWCKTEIYFPLLSPTSGSEIWVWWTLYTIQSYHSSCFQVVDFNYYYCLRFRPYILFKVTSGLEPGYSSEKGLQNSDTKELLQPCSPACEVPVISRKEECTSGTDSYFSPPLWFHGAQQCGKKTHKPCKESNVPSSLTNPLLWELWWVTSLLPNTVFWAAVWALSYHMSGNASVLLPPALNTPTEEKQVCTMFCEISKLELRIIKKVN